MGKILLFYKYVHIQYPKQILKWQKKVCKELGLTGRILLGHEGINGTLGGTVENTDKYKEIMNGHPLFDGIDFKEAHGGAEYFPRLYVTVRNEIVHLGVDPEKITPADGGKHLTPDEVHELIKKHPDNLIILDTRNDYEWRIGRFESPNTKTILPDIQNFRELPQYIDEHLNEFKDKEVLMYCTGGIRCERATSYLKSKHVAKEVYQIKGGIQRYTEKYPDGFFRGKNYVFDGRVADKINDDILTTCDICNIAYDEYTNCVNTKCNKHYIACDPCIKTLKNCCSTTCYDLVDKKEVTIRTKPLKVQIGTSCTF